MARSETKLFFVIVWILLNLCTPNQVYVPSGYLDCYTSLQLFEALTNKLYTSSSNNGDDCKYNCSLQNYMFAGTKDDKCFCGNVTEQGPSYGCITPCPGRGDEICGGPIEMSVYSTKEIPLSTLTPDVETTSMDNLTTEANITQRYVQNSTAKVEYNHGIAPFPVETVYLAVSLACVGLILSVVIIFLLIRRKGRKKQVKQKSTYQGNMQGERGADMTSVNVAHHCEPETYNAHACYNNDNVAIIYSTATPVHEYAICESEIEHNNVNAENTSEHTNHHKIQSGEQAIIYSTATPVYEYAICESEMEDNNINAENTSIPMKLMVDGYTNHHNIQSGKQVYSHVSNRSEALKHEGEYSHILTEDHVKDIPEKEVAKSDRQGYTNLEVAKRVEDTNEDLTYDDVSLSRGYDVQKDQSGEYSTLKY